MLLWQKVAKSRCVTVVYSPLEGDLLDLRIATLSRENRALTRPYEGMMVLNNPLIRPYFLGGVGICGGTFGFSWLVWDICHFMTRYHSLKQEVICEKWGQTKTWALPKFYRDFLEGVTCTPRIAGQQCTPEFTGDPKLMTNPGMIQSASHNRGQKQVPQHPQEGRCHQVAWTIAEECLYS